MAVKNPAFYANPASNQTQLCCSAAKNQALLQSSWAYVLPHGTYWSDWNWHRYTPRTFPAFWRKEPNQHHRILLHIYHNAAGNAQ